MSESPSVGHLWPPALLKHWGVTESPLPADLLPLSDDLGLAPEITGHLMQVYGPLVERLAHTVSSRSQPLSLGINGAQGTGKSTAAEVIAHLLERQGFRVCRLSIDDLYLTRHERQTLAKTVHPLLATRGVPGTHDLVLGLRVMDELLRADPTTTVAIPRFDKARDDRLPPQDWPAWQGKPHLIILEGWCVGARPQEHGALSEPVNALERDRDPEGHWRRYVNDRLQDYQRLFDGLDHLVLLRAPSFEQVYQWRAEQEAALARRVAQERRTAPGLMSEDELKQFISHYERLTRWILEEMPHRADLVFELNPAHRIERVIPSRGTAL